MHLDLNYKQVIKVNLLMMISGLLFSHCSVFENSDRFGYLFIR